MSPKGDSRSKWAAASKASSVSPAPKSSRHLFLFPQPPAVAAPVEEPNSAATAAVMNLPQKVTSVHAKPRFKWWVHLKKSIQSLFSLTISDEDETQAAMDSGRTREVRVPVTAVVDELLAKQWMMRYSEDNVTLASFELPHIISMVLGMPIMVAPVASTKN